MPNIYNAYRGRSRRTGIIDDRAIETWTPESISGLQQWLKADAITGKSDNDLIDIWSDSGTLGNNANKVNDNSRPAYKTNRLNGLPAVYFASGKVLNCGNIITNPYTLFLVYVLRNGGNRVIQGSNNWLIGPYGWVHSFFNNNWVGTGSAVANDQAVYSAVTSASGASTMRQNGVAKGSGSTDGIPGTLYMGYGGAYSGEQSIADICELFIYNSVLSIGNIVLAEEYLAEKYGF